LFVLNKEYINWKFNETCFSYYQNELKYKYKDYMEKVLEH
jgi:hypothetical protein